MSHFVFPRSSLSELTSEHLAGAQLTPGTRTVVGAPSTGGDEDDSEEEEETSPTFPSAKKTASEAKKSVRNLFLFRH